MNVTKGRVSFLLFLFSLFTMKKSDIIRLRIQVQTLAKQGHSVSEIARRLTVSRLFVRTWKDAKDPTADDRGWEKGKKRKYNDENEQKVLTTRDTAEQGFFSERRRFRTPSVMMFPSTSSNAPCRRTVVPNHTERRRKGVRNTCSTRSGFSMPSVTA